MHVNWTGNSSLDGLDIEDFTLCPVKKLKIRIWRFQIFYKKLTFKFETWRIRIIRLIAEHGLELQIEIMKHVEEKQRKRFENNKSNSGDGERINVGESKGEWTNE